MEEQEEQQEGQEKREPIFSRSAVPIIVVFAVINVAVVLLIFGGSIFGGSGGEGEGEGERTSVLEDTSLISLGRIEVSMPLNPLQQNFMRKLPASAVPAQLSNQGASATPSDNICPIALAKLIYSCQ